MRLLRLKARAVSFLAAFMPQAATADVTSWYPFREAVKRFEAKVSTTNTRIFGGSNVKIDDNPWQVALLHANDTETLRAQYCGGSVIAATWVITAAHCVDEEVTPEKIRIVANVDLLSNGAKRFKVAEIYVHPKWNRKTGDSDLALLQLSPSDSGLVGSPIAIYDLKKFNGSDKFLISGWGVTESRPQGTEKLQGVVIPYVPLERCTAPLAYSPYRLTINMYCAGQIGADTCKADSGGPAVLQNKSTPILAGIASWGDGCGKANKFGVYTKVANFAEWITATAK